MSKAGIFVDDKDKAYAKMLTKKGVIEFQYLPIDSEITALALEIRKRQPAVLALDYRLDEEVGDLGAEKSYRASPLAQILRDAAVEEPARDFPIVLVSAEENVTKLFDPDRTAHDLFDKVYVKAKVREDSANIQSELISLADAYTSLQNQPYSLEAFLDANEDDRDFVDQQELRSPVETSSAPHQVVGFLLKQLFTKPSLLLDDDDTAARLGITPQSFQAIRSKLKDAGLAYSGQLADGWPRWWAHRIEAFLTEKLGSRPITFTAHDRAEKLSAHFELVLDAATSPWTGKNDERISFACACCHRGAEIKHSVGAFEGTMPRYRIARRICWDCVQADRCQTDAPHLQIDDIDQNVVERVRKLDKPAVR